MAGLRSADVMNAAVDACRADATLTTLLGGAASVYAHVPPNTALPYVMLLPGQEVAFAESFDDDSARHVQVRAIGASNYAGTKELHDIVDRVTEILTAAATWAGVSGITAWRFVEAGRTVPSDGGDGRLIYEREVVVEVWVQ